MPDIEEVIFRLGMDGSAYTDGVEKLSASTKKLSEVQEKANAKLAELQKAQKLYKDTLETTNAIIKANEKETIELSKQLNVLRDAEKGTSAEATRLKQALRDTAVNTKELKVEAKELTTNLATTTKQINLQTKEIEAGVKANGSFAGAIGKSFSALRTLANIIPGVGIGGLVALISGPLIDAFGDWINSIGETGNALKLLKTSTEESFKGGEGAFVKASENVNELRLNVELAKQGFIDKERVVEQYNTTMGKTAGTVKTLDEVEQKLTEHGDAYIRMMLLKAAAHFALESAAKAAFEAEEKSRKTAEEFLTTGDKFVAFTAGLSSAPGAVPGIQQTQATGEAFRKARAEKEKKAAIQESEDAKNTFASIAKKFQEDAAQIAKEHGFKFDEDLKDPKGKASVQTKVITNIYADELQKLKIAIAKLDEKGFTNEASITKAIEEDFKLRASAFKKALDKGQLTQGQFTSLNAKLAELQKLSLDQSIKSFNDSRAALLQKIDTELSNIEDQTALKRIASIQNSYERQRQAIVFENDKTIKTREEARDKQIAEIKKSTILTPDEINTAVANVNLATAQLIEQVRAGTARQLQQLSFDTFEKISEDLQRRLKDKNLDISALTLIDIQKQTELLQQGKISYDQYQKELTRIAKEESAKRRELEIANLRIEINRRQSELRNNQQLTEAQGEKLLDEIRSREGQIDALERKDLEQDKPTKKDPKLDKFVKYTQAIGNLAQSVVGFWQQANAAEAAALDRSIALQEKRVDAAQKIADRGNAQYLKQEQDRLTQLNVQKENAARKQLGINAALQASEILVALISGLAQGAKIGGGLGAIASVAAIVAAIAGAFAIAASLKPPTPTFFKGTKDTGRGGDVDGKGGFVAINHPNEAIIPADRNKAYHPAVAAIYDKTIPAEHLNQFVNTYHKIKTVPQVDYSRIKGAAELHIGANGRMAVLLEENNQLQRQTLRAMKSMSVSASIDRDGVAIAVNEYISKMEIDKRI